jgi:hypothetical protein
VTTTGVDESKDSPFSLQIFLTLPWKRRVEVAITVSPFSAFLGYPYISYNLDVQDIRYFHIQYVPLI